MIKYIVIDPDQHSWSGWFSYPFYSNCISFMYWLLTTYHLAIPLPTIKYKQRVFYSDAPANTFKSVQWIENNDEKRTRIQDLFYFSRTSRETFEINTSVPWHGARRVVRFEKNDHTTIRLLSVAQFFYIFVFFFSYSVWEKVIQYNCAHAPGALLKTIKMQRSIASSIWRFHVH